MARVTRATRATQATTVESPKKATTTSTITSTAAANNTADEDATAKPDVPIKSVEAAEDSRARKKSRNARRKKQARQQKRQRLAEALESLSKTGELKPLSKQEQDGLNAQLLGHSNPKLEQVKKLRGLEKQLHKQQEEIDHLKKLVADKQTAAMSPSKASGGRSTRRVRRSLH